MIKRIQVVPYDGLWPCLFQREAERIQKALGENCAAVYHIGSTSVPGLFAKPIIDILPVVLDLKKVDSNAMGALGYEAKGENGIAFRQYFQKGTPEKTHHIHVYEKGNVEIDRHLRFCEWMRAHPQDCKAYGNLKKRLSLQFPYDIRSYVLGKEGFIQEIYGKLGLSKQRRLLMALTDRDWMDYHRIRRTEIFDPIGIIYDEQHPSLTDENHYHFLLREGCVVVSTTHLEALTASVAALRTLATDRLQQRKGFASYMMDMLEK